MIVSHLGSRGHESTGESHVEDVRACEPRKSRQELCTYLSKQPDFLQQGQTSCHGHKMQNEALSFHRADGGGSRGPSTKVAPAKLWELSVYEEEARDRIRQFANPSIALIGASRLRAATPVGSGFDSREAQGRATVQQPRARCSI